MIKLISSFLFLTIFSFANPTPLGFEINKATFSDVKKEFPEYKEKGISKFSNGKVIYLHGEKYKKKGFYRATFIFSNNDVLWAVILFPTGLSDKETSRVLQEKYKLVEKVEISPFNKEYEEIYSYGNTKIIFYRENYSNELVYIYDELANLFIKTKENENKKQQEKILQNL